MNIKSKGFTLIELLVVVSIIGILSTIILGSLEKVRDRALEAAAITEIKQLEKLILQAKLNTNLILANIMGLGGCGNACTCQLPSGYASPSCEAQWKSTVDAIISAAGENPSLAESFYENPWGLPYSIDPNEGENGNWCFRDQIYYVKEVNVSGGRGIIYTLPSFEGKC